jgi:hypothetical protein
MHHPLEWVFLGKRLHRRFSKQEVKVVEAVSLSFSSRLP